MTGSYKLSLLLSVYDESIYKNKLAAQSLPWMRKDRHSFSARASTFRAAELRGIEFFVPKSTWRLGARCRAREM